MEDVAELRRSHTEPFARIADDVAAVRNDGPAGPIYVFGNPLYHLHFDRTQAIPMHDWGWGFAVEEQWRALPSQLADGKPAFVYLSREVCPLIEQRSPETSAFLSANYTLIKQDAFGSFHRRRANLTTPTITTSRFGEMTASNETPPLSPTCSGKQVER